ncbi:hypothetical protein S1OALGB6SA_990, partial [Olavius algarvensis spirochete endosymbiont]
EAARVARPNKVHYVAPLAGAWIETRNLGVLWRPCFVAPLAGAWIETGTWEALKRHKKSHPSRVRGLKLIIIRMPSTISMSHPSRVRGLKHRPVRLCRYPGPGVAPLAGAWIETLRLENLFLTSEVAPLAGAWIETPPTSAGHRSSSSHPSRVRGLKQNIRQSDQAEKSTSHPSRVRGLKLYYTYIYIYSNDVAPLAGAWIETRGAAICGVSKYVAPLAGAWIET